MPLYEYKCEKCGQVFEVIQRFSDQPLTQHEGCGGNVEKLISRSSIQFKGSGFYINDYAKGSGGGSTSDKKSSSESSDSSGKSESKSDTKTESKSEGKSDSKSESKSESKPDSKPAAPASTSKE